MESQEEAKKNLSEFLKKWNSPLPYIEIQTSGSTGKPKLIQLSKSMMIESARRTNNFFNINGNSLLYNCVSTKYIGGIMMNVRAIESGGKIINENASNRPSLLIGKNGSISLLAVVASQMIHILEEKKHSSEFPKIDNIIIGGSAINPSLRNDICQSSLNAYETYGMTETSSHIALRRIESNEKPFILLPGIKIETDSRGCLVISLNDSEQIITNDLVEIISENQFFIKGRYDNVIISGGKKIHPEQIEHLIAQKYNYQFIVSSRPHTKWGQELIIISENEEMRSRSHEIIELVRKNLPEEYVPKDFVIVKKLPRNQMGKVKRFQI